MTAAGPNSQQRPEPTVSAVVVAPSGQLLLVRSPKWADCWMIPGGHIELGELAEETVRREVLEETGLAVKLVRLLFVQEVVFPPEFYASKHLVSLTHVCMTDDPRVHLDGDELAAYCWADPWAALSMRLASYARAAVARYLSDLSGTRMWQQV